MLNVTRICKRILMLSIATTVVPLLACQPTKDVAPNDATGSPDPQQVGKAPEPAEQHDNSGQAAQATEDGTTGIRVLEAVDIGVGEDPAPTLKVHAQLVSSEDTELKFSTSEIFVLLKDGSRTQEWLFFSFFDSAIVDLKAGESLSQVGEYIEGELSWINGDFSLVDRDSAMITLSLVKESPQEAELLFLGATVADAAELKIGTLPAVRLGG